MIKIAICRKAQVRGEWVSESLEEVIGSEGEFESFWSASDLQRYIDQYGYVFNAYFFDNKVTGIDFVELARTIRKKDTMAFFFFIDYAMPKTAAVKELIPYYGFERPFDLEFLKVVYRWAMHYQDKTKDDFTFRYNRTAYRFLKEEIMYFEKEKRNAYLYTTDGKKQKMIATRSEIMEHVNPDLFVEVDVSYIVNLLYIKNVEKDKLLLSNGVTLNIARRKRKNLLQKMDLYNQFLR